MRRRSSFYDDRAKPEVIAMFGAAQLVRLLDGKMKLRGGSAEDQREAREWVSQFLPDVLASMPPPLDRRTKSDVADKHPKSRQGVQ